MTQPSSSESLWDNLKQIIFAIVLALLIKTSVVEAYKIPSQSMEDTLLVGDFLLANKFIYGARVPIANWRFPAIRDPQAGDVIIFIYPLDGVTKYIKRCVAVAGDTVLVKNKELFVNGKRFEDAGFTKFIDTLPSGKQSIRPRRAGGQNSRDNYGPFIVPRDCFFMMGDSRDNSSDSRVWGPVHRDLILGSAMAIHWSWNESEYPSPDVSVTDPLSVPRLFLYNTVHFFQKVRWSRLFNSID